MNTLLPLAEKIRGHWLIKNQVHWVKDVICNEDKSKIKDRQTARNLLFLYTIIMNSLGILILA